MLVRQLLFAVGAMTCAASIVGGQSPVPTRLVREASDVRTRIRLGDRVTIAGRVTLGWGVLDTARISIYVQDSSGGVLVAADRPTPFVRPVIGDSVMASGVVAREDGQTFLDEASLNVLPVAPSAPAPIRADALMPARLSLVQSKLVAIEGIVATANLDRGDRVLIISDTVTEGSYVAIVDDEDGDAGLNLRRFDVGDRIRVIGVLSRRTSRSGITRFTVYPRTAADLVPLAMTTQARRALAGSLGTILIASTVIGFAWRAQRRRRVALQNDLHAREEATERFRVLVEQAPIGLVVLRESRIAYANRAFAALVAEPVPAALHNRSLADFVYSGDSLSNTPAPTDHLATSADSRLVAWRLKRSDHGIVDVEIAQGPIVYEGQPCMQLVVYDVSERARIKHALAESEAQLRQAQKLEAVGQLAGGVAHDFNNLLTAIKGNTSLLMDGCATCGHVPEEAREIDEATSRAAALTSQLLTFSRKQVSTPRVVELDELVRNLERMLLRLVPENVSQRFTLAATKNLVRVDPGQIEQVILNLVLNARDAMPLGGTLALRTSNVVVEAGGSGKVDGVTMAPGRYVCLIVSDTGVGMDATTRQRAFEPFFTTKDAGKGTGLGLATAYGIVRQSGGYIVLNSLPGMGTTAKIYLPQVDAALAEPRHAPDAVVASARGVETVLVVEDEPAIRRITALTLQRHGYVVLVAASGEEALSLVRGHPGTIDMLLTDVIMPGLSGVELAEHLREAGSTIRVLFMSGYTDDHLANYGALTQDIDLLHKPFTPKEMLDSVRRVLDREHAAAVV